MGNEGKNIPKEGSSRNQKRYQLLEKITRLFGELGATGNKGFFKLCGADERGKLKGGGRDWQNH